MPYASILRFALSILCLASCSQVTETTTELITAQTTQVQFRTRTLQRSSPGCATDSTVCAKVSINYPEAVGGKTVLRESINTFVQQRLRRLALDFNPDADTTTGSNAADFLAAFFLSQHQQLTAEFADSAEIPASIARWELKVTGKPLLTADQATSLQLEIFYYTGGAHPNYYRVLQSFGSSCEKLSATDMVTDTVALMRLAEKEFRKVKAVGPDKPLTEAGLFIEDDFLPLPQNVALAHKGLLLYYNPYEIGPWAFGDTELLLPYEELAGLLRPKYKGIK